MGIERITNEHEYSDALRVVRELAKNEPDSESETADIINHLSILAAEWAEINLPKQTDITQKKMKKLKKLFLKNQLTNQINLL